MPELIDIVTGLRSPARTKVVNSGVSVAEKRPLRGNNNNNDNII